MTRAPALELRGIVRQFGPMRALDGVDFAVEPGEIHTLLGENGAGKSTLMHVAYGMLRPDAGDIVVDGTVRTIASPRDARRLGLGMVHQHFTSIPSLTVAENIALAAGWPVAPAGLRERVRQLVAETGLPLDPDARAETLTVALKQRLEIVKALAANARVLLLDEPTAVLAPAEAEELLRMVRRFVARGNAAVLITHKLDEALSAADRVTVLRAGRVAHTGPAGEATSGSLARAMIGDGAVAIGPATVASGGGLNAALGVAEVLPVRTDFSPARADTSPARATTASREVAVRVCELEVRSEGGARPALRNASLDVHAGEIVGVAGVEGNGQRELLRAIAGLIVPERGDLSVAAPVAFVPEDRITEGLIPEMSLTENLVLGAGDDAPWLHRGRIRWRAARGRMSELIGQFGILAAGPDAPAATLSGGNQQKVVIARALERAPRVLVAENPTRGLDVRAAAFVHERLRIAARAGVAVLFSSSDLDEIVLLADRIVVAAGGRLGEAPAGSSRAEIGAMMLGRVGE